MSEGPVEETMSDGWSIDKDGWIIDGDNETVISVYFDTGIVYHYNVSDPIKGREHAAKIISTGYRSTPHNTNDLEWFPPHRIDKVKVTGGGESTKYRDTARAT